MDDSHARLDPQQQHPPVTSLTQLTKQLSDAETQISNLLIALENSRFIGAAVGIIMSTHRATQNDAFELLQQTSQRQNRKLREVAEDVVLMGTLIAPDDASM